MSTNDYDFGFTFEDEEIVLSSSPPAANTDQLLALQAKLDSLLDSQEQLLVTALEEKYKAKLKEVEGMILPLLYNLMKNPEKAYIKWENRVPVIQKQIDKITAITRG